MHIRFFLTLTLLSTVTTARAAVFHCDPIHGDMANDGSANAPWTTLQEVFDNHLIETRSYSPLPYTAASSLVTKNPGAPIKAGDTLMLRNGYHGEIFYRGIYNADYLTIMNAPGSQPTLGSIQISAGAKFIFDGLVISPENAPIFFYAQLFFLESHGYHGPSRDIVLRNCTLKGITDASGWGLTEWNAVGSCIKVAGNKSLVENCQCLNIDEGISILADSCEVKSNQIINFAGDGMRGQGSHLLFEYNLVKNCYDIDDNHDDGFQAFTTTSNPFIGNILRGNTFINYEDINQPFRGSLQGIGCFDGPYVDWIIENNLVVVNHYHGISLYGAENCKIMNNTVVDIDSINSPNGTWIRITDHKNGTPSSGCTIQNNISFGFSYGNETTFSNNLLVDHYQEFADAINGDFSLRAGSSAIDMGLNTGAPTQDINGFIRPINGIVDIGAFEFQSGPACTKNQWLLNTNLTMSIQEFVKDWLKTSGSIELAPQTVHEIQVGNYAEFNPGFEVTTGAEMQLEIGPCIDL